MKATRLTAREDIAVAARALYARLTAQQKELADARFPSIVSALATAGMPSYSRAEARGDRPAPVR